MKKRLGRFSQSLFSYKKNFQTTLRGLYLPGEDRRNSSDIRRNDYPSEPDSFLLFYFLMLFTVILPKVSSEWQELIKSSETGGWNLGMEKAESPGSWR